MMYQITTLPAVPEPEYDTKFNLCCLMTPGLSKDLQCHVRPYSLLCLQITSADVRPQVKWASNLVIANGLFNLPLGYVWVYVV